LGHRSQGLRQGPGPSRHLGWPLHSLSQLSPKDLNLAHGLGNVTPGLVPLADDLAKPQPPLLHLLGPGSHLLLDRGSLFSSRLRLCPRRRRYLRLQLIAEQPKVLKLSKRGLEWQGRPSRGTPTPLGYGYLTRHLPRRATHTRLSGSASRQASPSARNEEETQYYTQIPRCSGLDSHNEHAPTLRVPLQTELRFHSRGYEQPSHQRACGITNSEWLTDDHCTSSDNDLRLGRQDSCSDGLKANTAVERPSFTSPRGGREPAIKAKEPEARSAGGTDGLAGGSSHRCGGKPLQRKPPPQHRRQQPPAHQHRTSKRRPLQSAPTGPHSRSRHENENGIVPEHEYRPRGVRRVVRPPGAVGHTRPGGGRNAAPWPGSSSLPSLAWLEDASSAELEDALLPRMTEEEAGRQPTQRRAPTRCAPLPSPDDEDP
jgi:hypothetical protein